MHEKDLSVFSSCLAPSASTRQAPPPRPPCTRCGCSVIDHGVDGTCLECSCSRYSIITLGTRGKIHGPR